MVCLLTRARGKSGDIEIIKGPHYQQSFARIREVESWPTAYLFRIAGRIVCVTLSKDLEFDQSKLYEIDENKGEFFVYPKIIDEVDIPL
jgi:hypothetical protein